MGPAGLLHRGADYTKGEGGKGTLVRRKWWPHTTWCVPRAARCGEYQAWRGVIRGRRTEGSRSVKSRFEAQSGSHGVPQVCARAGRAWRSVRLRGARDRVNVQARFVETAQRSSAICGDAVCALERLTSCPPMPVENRDEPRSVSDELVQFAATATAAAAQQYQQSVCTTSARYGYIFFKQSKLCPVVGWSLSLLLLGSWESSRSAARPTLVTALDACGAMGLHGNTIHGLSYSASASAASAGAANHKCRGAAKRLRRSCSSAGSLSPSCRHHRNRFDF